MTTGALGGVRPDAFRIPLQPPAVFGVVHAVVGVGQEAEDDQSVHRGKQ